MPIRKRGIPPKEIKGRTVKASKPNGVMDIKAGKGNREIPSYLEMSGTVEIDASAQLENGEVLSGGERFFLIANTGKPMRLTGFFDPVIIDITGASYDKKKTAIIADHDTSMRIGHTMEQLIIANGKQGKIGSKTLSGPVIAAVGVRSSKSQVAQSFIDDSREGFPFQVSVGAEILDGYFVAEGETVDVNGQTWSGPLIVASKTSIRELTVTVLGADNDTATIAAKTKPRKESSAMNPFEKWLKEMGLEVEALSADSKTKLEAQFKKLSEPVIPPAPNKKVKAKSKSEPDEEEDEEDEENVQRTSRLRASIAQEHERIDAIRATVARFEHVTKVTVDEKELTMPQLRAHAIKNNWTPDQVELHARRGEYPEPSSGPAIHSKNLNIEAQALEASILRSTGCPELGVNKISGKKFGLEAMYKPEVLEASHGRQYQTNNSIAALLDIQIRAGGKSPISTNKDDLFAQAHDVYHAIKASGFSTLSVTNILENVMHKSALAAFDSVETIWRYLCARRPLNDFKVHALYRLDFNGQYRKVAADGELKHISMVDTKKTIQAETFGAMITIDRKTRRNDDLNLITDKARGLGLLASERIEESVFVLLLSNPSSFFAAGNNNLITGGASALSITSLETARNAFRAQVINGKPVGVSPSILLTGTTLQTTAEQLWTLTGNDGLRVGGGNTDTGLVFLNNPHKGLYRPYATPYLNNTAVLDQDGNAISGQSATQWYLSAPPSAPQGAALNIGFLDGRETPYFDQQETQFNIPGGISFRSYMDWGVAMHMTQMMLKSAGA